MLPWILILCSSRWLLCSSSCWPWVRAPPPCHLLPSPPRPLLLPVSMQLPLPPPLHVPRTLLGPLATVVGAPITWFVIVGPGTIGMVPCWMEVREAPLPLSSVLHVAGALVVITGGSLRGSLSGGLRVMIVVLLLGRMACRPLLTVSL